MREVRFRHLLDSDNALRVRFDVEGGRVSKFLVQLESRYDGDWVPVIRYDTAHGFAHCDRLHPYKPTEKRRLATSTYEEALNFAIQDVKANWRRYHRRYEQWLKQR